MSYIKGVTDWLNIDLLSTSKVIPSEADCGEITLKGKYVAIKTDNILVTGTILPTLYNAGSIRCVSDYVIVSEDVVLICELKSNNEGRFKVQLKNTLCLVKYILTMVKIQNKITEPLPKINFVCFANLYKSIKQNATLSSFEWNGGELYKLPCNTIYQLNQFV